MSKEVEEGQHSRRGSLTFRDTKGSVTSLEVENARAEDVQLALEFGYKPVFKREFGYLATISFAFSIGGLFPALMTTFAVPLTSGGPAAVVWCWGIAGIGCLAIAVRTLEKLARSLLIFGQGISR